MKVRGPSFGKASAICAIGIVASAGIFYGAYRILRYKSKEAIVHTKWRAVGILKALYMYPLDTGHRYEIQDAYCSKRGLYKIIDGVDWRDRGFVVYDASTKECKTAREYPALVLINIKPLSNEKFGLSTPDEEEIKVDLPKVNQTSGLLLNMKNKTLLNCWDCGDEAAKFISMVIMKNSSGLRLCYHDGNFNVTSSTAKELINEISRDFYAYHLVSKTSLDKLNKELDHPVTEHYFRPNLYVHGRHIKPWEEESWEWIKIGGAIFRNLKPHVRCDINTINPQTGEMNKNGEPLKTLEKVAMLKNKQMYRSDDGSPVMGIRIELHTEGEIEINDQVYIAENLD